MMIKEDHNKTGPITNYVGFIFLVFCWYFLDNIYTSAQPIFPGSSIEILAGWVYRLVVVPILFAGVYGGIREQQRTEDTPSVNAFLNGVKTSYWRIMGANLLSIAFILIITIFTLAFGWAEQPDLGDNKSLLAIISIPYSAATLFWFAGIVVKRKVFKGLALGIKTLLTNPIALAIGITWGAIGFADTYFFDFQNDQISFAVNGIRAGVLAMARILAIVYAFTVYEHARDKAGYEIDEELASGEVSSTAPGEGLVKASIGFSFVSFLPFFHLVALVLGILALKRKKRFVLSSAVACCLGAFFTIFYGLLVTGWIVTASAPSTIPTYKFLAETNPEVESQVTLLEQGAFQEIDQQLGQGEANKSGRHWAYDCVSALAKYFSYDLEGALDDFHIAAEKEPERSEFYYFYGLALLDNDQTEMAATQFQNALTHGPRLEAAQRYLDLIDSTYTPSIVVSSMGFVIILLLLFTLHEYGHAFAAWKLGDDTAKNQGRLTLNPVPHLDLFGSLVLPAILLWRQSEFMFGWAKPVPVNPENFKDPHKDHMRVSFAGPAMNLIVAMVCFIILAGIMLFVRLFWPESLSLNFATPFSSVSLVGPPFARGLLILIVFLKQFFYTSLVLGIFNLLPVPPLDGSWILSGLLPQRFSYIFEQIRRFGFVIFLLLVVTPVLDYIMSIPISLAWGAFQLLASGMGLG
jgi:Zn-dependent protease